MLIRWSSTAIASAVLILLSTAFAQEADSQKRTRTALPAQVLNAGR